MIITIFELEHHAPRDLRGGDETVHRMLEQVFESAGLKIEIIRIDPTKSLTNRLIRKILGGSFIYSSISEKLYNHSDLVICDSVLSYGIRMNNCITLSHYSFDGYLKALKPYFDFRNKLCFKIMAYIQKSGLKNKYNVSVSEYLTEIFRLEKVHIDKTITSSVDTGLFYPNKTKRNGGYLYAGGYSYYGKGIDVLENIASKGLAIDCVTNVKPGGGLNWIPSKRHSEMPALYNKYNILLYPSRFESLGMVPIEAMACGLPVVMSNVGIGQKIKKEIPEFVVEGYDDRSINEYINRIHIIESDYEHYSKIAREYVLKYHSFEVFKQEWLLLVKNILNEKKCVQ